MEKKKKEDEEKLEERARITIASRYEMQEFILGPLQAFFCFAGGGNTVRKTKAANIAPMKGQIQ